MQTEYSAMVKRQQHILINHFKKECLYIYMPLQSCHQSIIWQQHNAVNYEGTGQSGSVNIYKHQSGKKNFYLCDHEMVVPARQQGHGKSNSHSLQPWRAEMHHRMHSMPQHEVDMLQKHARFYSCQPRTRFLRPQLAWAH